jgi:hypothetical protein
MRVRNSLSSITANIGYNNYNNPQEYKVGKVYAVILNEQSVPKKVWDSNGGWDGVGTILYEEYREDLELSLENLSDSFIEGLSTALPLYPNQKYFPLPGEIVMLMVLPSAPSPITNKTEETYYVSVINAWNSPQFNGLFKDNDKTALYKSFNENQDFRGIQTFEGDYILEGRFGNSIRFGSTNKEGNKDLSPWSTNPFELSNNPITILSNQHGNKLPNSDLFVEDINKDGSSIYLTSKQSISLDIGKVKLSDITLPIGISDYIKPQVIINAYRTIISSKEDEVLIFGRKGIENYSQGPIYLQSNNVGITMQDDQIFLGPTSENITQSPEPLVLGLQMTSWLSELSKALSDFASTVAPTLSTPEGTTLQSINAAGTALQDAIEKLSNQLKNDSLLSKTTNTI